MDLENDGGDASFEFSDDSVRRGFVRKVYSILTIQLLITLGLICIFTFVQPLQDALQNHPSIFWVPLVLSLVLMIVLVCAGNLRRKSPLNLIFLILFTICEGITIGAICSTKDADDVVYAVITTIVVTAGLTIFAFQTKIDFTMKSGMLASLIMVLLMFGLFALILRSNVLNIMYACLGALIFSLYIVFDTQLMLGGKHKMALSPEEYICAALNLYLDIINLFLMILTLFGAGNN